MKLIALMPPAGISLPGMRPLGMFTIWLGHGQFKDWQVKLHGPSVFLIAPEDFTIGEVKPADGQRRVYELPRAACHLVWDFAPGDKLEDAAKWGPPVVVSAEDSKGKVKS